MVKSTFYYFIALIVILIPSCKKENNSAGDKVIKVYYAPNSVISSGEGVLAHVSNYEKNVETFICGTWNVQGGVKKITQVVVKEMGGEHVTVMRFDTSSRPKFIFRTNIQSTFPAPVVIRCNYSPDADTVYRKTFVKFDSVETRVLIASQRISGTPQDPIIDNVYNKHEAIEKAEIAPAVVILAGVVGWSIVKAIYNRLINAPSNFIDNTLSDTEEGAQQTSSYLNDQQSGQVSYVQMDAATVTDYSNTVSSNNFFNSYNTDTDLDDQTSGGVEIVENDYDGGKTELINDCTFYYQNINTGGADSVVGSTNHFTFTGITQNEFTGYRFLAITPDGKYRAIPGSAAHPVGPSFNLVIPQTISWSGNSFTLNTCDHWNGNPWYAAIWTFFVTRNGINFPLYSVLTISNRPNGAN